MIRLTLPVPPSVNQWTRALGRGRQVKTRAARDYLDRVAAICRAAKVRPYREPVAVTLTWYRARRSGDLDNRLKLCLDSLVPWAMEDDRYVEAIHAFRVDGDLPARIEVCVEPTEGHDMAAFHELQAAGFRRSRARNAMREKDTAA